MNGAKEQARLWRSLYPGLSSQVFWLRSLVYSSYGGYRVASLTIGALWTVGILIIVVIVALLGTATGPLSVLPAGVLTPAPAPPPDQEKKLRQVKRSNERSFIVSRLNREV